MYKLCLAVLVALVIPTVATAGGGNTKKTSTIRFKNTKGGDTVYVIVADAATLETTNAGNFARRGGKVLNGVSTVVVSKLKAGLQTYAYARVALNDPIPAPGDFEVEGATLNAGKTTNITLP